VAVEVLRVLVDDRPDKEPVADGLAAVRANANDEVADSRGMKPRAGDRRNHIPFEGMTDEEFGPTSKLPARAHSAPA
jgi:hypothetical protein